MSEETTVGDIEEQGEKWLKYMNSQTLSTLRTCPNNHKLLVYKYKNELVLTCPKFHCAYYDYNNYRVPIGAKINEDIKFEGELV